MMNLPAKERPARQLTPTRNREYATVVSVNTKALGLPGKRMEAEADHAALVAERLLRATGASYAYAYRSVTVLVFRSTELGTVIDGNDLNTIAERVSATALRAGNTTIAEVDVHHVFSEAELRQTMVLHSFHCEREAMLGLATMYSCRKMVMGASILELSTLFAVERAALPPAVLFGTGVHRNGTTNLQLYRVGNFEAYMLNEDKSIDTIGVAA